MIDLDHLRSSLDDPEAEPWRDRLIATIQARIDRGHGDLPRWQQALAELPPLTATRKALDAATVAVDSDLAISPAQSVALEAALRGLMPWRKGPFAFFGIPIDTEWRSDWKWDRLAHAMAPLNNRRVLDIGCGNGYHLWRIRASGARLALGIDPSLLFLCQFAALQTYAKEPHIHLAPLAMEAFPQDTAFFDTVFCMGVLYHRRSPMDFLRELLGQLRPGGELVLETLVIDGDETCVLVPESRYARMRNVWFIPSSAALSLWLRRVGFRNVRVIDECITDVKEQRSTDWMRYESLAECLNPDQPDLTIEGLPAPKRAIVIAERP
ncbi:MAG TPA: tRNA 5-methoxyuridine(34)/uridine 5-oxyacetic acid(34) synthase CmoB, partial [Gammaproteobacteria bacterium]|nr:tRNA 5-methoxyuridine(34)/uridine 5-oxyacetic acid(34) synthase CmoB [Gammaproteobacteria bacterium]